jgi:hypothetical protein
MKTRRIYGIDFSAAVDAGRKIWIAGGHIRGKTLEIDSCRRAEDLPGSSTVRDVAHSVLRRLIEEDAEGAFGLDFPFGLSRILTGQETWRKFILQFPVLYCSPEDFRNSCLSQAGGYELKRFTETEAKTPFSPYNLRLYRQTYFGISNVLRPLVAKGLVRVLPMQRPKEGKPWVLEICPASTLKKREKNGTTSQAALEKQIKVAPFLVQQNGLSGLLLLFRRRFLLFRSRLFLSRSPLLRCSLLGGRLLFCGRHAIPPVRFDNGKTSHALFEETSVSSTSLFCGFL